MPDFQEIKDRRRDRRANRHRDKVRRKKQASESRRALRIRVFKVVACVVVLAVFLGAAIMVGDADYHATLVGWLPFFMAVMAIVLAFAYLAVLKRSISYTETPASLDCKRGTDIRFDVHFKNSGPLFFFRIEAYFYISDLFGNVASESMTTLALGPHEVLDVGFNSTFDHIGTYSAGLEKIVISDFLGLFTATIDNKFHRTVNVTPRLVMLDDIVFSQDAMQETTKAAKSVIADSMDYSHVREYVPGDPLKTIHWNLSARTETYMTRLYEMYTNPGVGIVLDFYSPATEATDLMGAFDAVVESAFSLAQYSREKGMDTELFFRDRHGANQRIVTWTEDDFAQLIDDMPKMTNDPEKMQVGIDILKDQIVSQFGQNNIIVCSANLDARLIDTVVEAKIRRRSPMMVAVVPSGLDGRARDKYCMNLSRLDAADIPYIVISHAEDLVGGVA